MKAPIFIIGAGPTGLALALELARHKVDVRIFDKEVSRHHESRALALQPRTLEIFEKFNVLDRILEKGKKIYHYKVYLKGKHALDLDYATLSAPFPFMCLLSQNETENILIEELAKHEVYVERKVNLKKIHPEKNGLKVTLENDLGENQSYEIAYLIGCDGANSTVRRLAEIPFNRVGITHNYLLADVLLSWDKSPNAVRSFQHPKGLITIIPIKDNHYRMICDLKDEKDEVCVSQTYLKKVTLERVPEHLHIDDIQWMSDLKLSYREAEVFRDDRIFLAGDAAHLHSPIAGQGLNTGIQDVFNLGWKLAYLVKYQVKSKLLSSYSRERKPVAHKIINNTHRLIELSSPDSFFLRSFKDFVLSFFDHVKTLRKMATYDLAGLTIHYKKSPIVHSAFRWLFFLKAVRAGERFEDGMLLNPKTRHQIRLFSLVQNPQHHLFLFIRKRHQRRAHYLRDRLNERYHKVMGIHIISPDEDLPDEHYWIDTDRAIAKPYRLFNPFMVLVRPDNHIGLIAKGLHEEKVHAYFKELLSAYF